MSCGVDLRCGLDPAWLWLWLWCRLVATASIQPLTWEPPYAAGVAQEMDKKKKKKKREKGPLNVFKPMNQEARPSLLPSLKWNS